MAVDPGIERSGTDFNDSFSGTIAGDTLYGLGGDDTLRGLAGDDLIEGGNGNDELHSGFGNDTLFGGEGNDTITGNSFENFNTFLDGGAGNDYLQANASGNNTLFGGAGNDVLEGRGANLILDGGSGNDTLSFNGSNVVATGGEGRDLFNINYDPVLITDFTAGAGGDVIYGHFFPVLSRNEFEGLNPFASGQLRLVQNGADTLLQFNENGSGTENYTTVATLQDVVATDLRTENFTLGVDPWAPLLPTDILWTGTNGPNTYTGTRGHDTLRGLDGNDSISGAAGNDLIDGGNGNDSLRSGFGNDTLIGGEGNDVLLGDGYANFNTFLDGGNGNDFLQAGADGNNTLLGGAGNDVLEGRGANLILDGGSGNDTLSSSASNTVATGGEGRDLFNLSYNHIRITDFTAGVNGDVINGHFFPILSQNEFEGLNPFASGQLRLVQDGANTLLQFNVNGSESGTYDTLATLENVVAASLRAENFTLGVDPWAPLPPRDVFWSGTNGTDSYTGSRGHDTLHGLDGNDSIGGVGGDDFIDGGSGNDSLRSGSGNDTLIGGEGNDSLNGDSYFTHDTFLNGGGGNDFLQANASGSNIVLGGAGNDWLYGRGQSLILDGGTGSDTLSSAASNVEATGGEGRDLFLISFGQTMVISDFETGAGGDRLACYHGLAGLSSGRFEGVDPFASGQLQWTQDGENTLFQFDPEADGGAYTLAVLENVIASDIIAQNIFTVNGTAANDYLEGSDRNDTLDGLNGNDTVLGANGNDRVGGANGNDYVWGGNGNDTLSGGAGRDTLVGGSGDDLFIVGHSGTAISETSFRGDVDRVRAAIDYELNRSIEDLTLSGRASIDGTGNAADNDIEGNRGANLLDGQAGKDLLIGSQGNDQLVGGLGHDTLIGGRGADQLNGTGRSDGSGEIEFLTGGTQGDRFVLGDSSGRFYDDKGKSDYAFITDFTVGSDRLALRGSEDQYYLGSVNVSKGSGVGLFFSGGKEDELVAVIRSGNNTELTEENTVQTARFS